MADEFKARVIAELDATQFQRDINTLLNNRFTVTIANAQFSAQAIANLQQQLNNLSANINININANNARNAGQQFGMDVSAEINSVIQKTRPFTALETQLKAMSIPDTAISRFIQDLEKTSKNAEVQVTRLTASMAEGGKTVNLVVDGIDKKTGAQIRQLKELDVATGKVQHTGERITRSFANNPVMGSLSGNVSNIVSLFKELGQIRLTLNGLDPASEQARVLNDRFLQVHQRILELTQSTTGLANGAYQLNAVDQSIENIGLSSQNVTANMNTLQQSLVNAFSGVLSGNAMGKFTDDLSKSVSAIDQYNAKVQDMRIDTLANMYKQSATAAGDFGTKLTVLSGQVAKFTGSSSALSQQVLNLRNQMNHLGDIQDPLEVIKKFAEMQRTFKSIESQLKASSGFPKYTQEVNALVASFKELGSTRLKLDALTGIPEAANEAQALNGRIREVEQRIISLVQKMEHLDPAHIQTLKDQFVAFANAGDSAEIEFAELQRLLQGLLGNIPVANFQKLAAALTANTSAFAIAKANVQDMANACQQSVSINGELSNRYEALSAKILSLGKSATSLHPTLASIKNEMSALATETNPDAVVNKFKNIEKALVNLEVKAKQAEQALKLKSDKTSFALELVNALNRLTPATEKFRQQIETIKASISGTDKISLDGLKAQFDNVKERMKDAERQVKLTEQQIQTLAKAKISANNIEAWMQKNQKAAKVFKKELEGIVNTLNSDTIGNKLYKSTMLDFKGIESQARKAGLLTNNLGKSFKGFALQALGLSSTLMVFQKCVQLIRNMYEEVVKVDTAMTELYRVTNLSTAQYEGLYERMTNSAKAYGVALSDLINSTASWVRLGFDANTSAQLSEITSMYQHVTDLDEGTAVKNLVTAYKGYQDALLQVHDNNSTDAILAIVDRYDKLGKRNCPRRTISVKG